MNVVNSCNLSVTKTALSNLDLIFNSFKKVPLFDGASYLLLSPIYLLYLFFSVNGFAMPARFFHV